MSESLKNIAVLGDADLVFSTQVLEGVQAFAGRNPTWRVVPLHCTQDDLLDDLLRHGRIDGVIGAFISARWIAGLPGKPVPLVNIGALSDLGGVPSVIPDNAAVGRLAAGHLLDGGWRVLGCIHDVASFAAGQRRDGFVSAVREHSRSGGEVSEPPASESFFAGANWAEWLRGLQLPAAIFCTSDTLARRLIGVLRRIDLRVPEQIAVVGVGDSAFDSALAGMGISSVVLPGRRIGVRAAARLHALMAQGAEDRGVEHVPPETLIVRDSSAVVWTRDAVVSRAVGLMLQRPEGGLSATALAKRIGLSRRALEVRFQRALGHGPATEMRRRRLALVRRLLSDTEFTLEQISERTGFCGAHHLAAQFKRTFGLTPGEHRRRSRAGQITARI
jgi:LacI family transcriptional regulator